jgi:hypothetical protein
MLPDPSQRTLTQDPDVIAREDDKRRIMRVRHHHVVTWCESLGRTPPTARQWEAVQEVLTFLRYCEWANGGDPTSVQVARGCSRRGRKMSERSAERALGLANELGVLFSAGQGRSASSRTILYARLREMTAATESAEPVAPTRQTEMINAAKWRSDDADLAERATQNGGSILISDPRPLPNQPTTVDPPCDGSTEWAVVEREVHRAGVNQASAAVRVARDDGATLDDVRELLAYWRTHRRGWEYAEYVLYLRLRRFQRGQSACDGWPPLSESYQAELARTAQLERSAADARRQCVVRAEIAAARASSIALWQQGHSLAATASAIAPELAAELQAGARRAALRVRLCQLGAPRNATTEVLMRMVAREPRPP